MVQQLFPCLPAASIIHYECGHVVPKESLVALVAAKGPTGRQLCLRHEERGRPEVMDEVRGRVKAVLLLPTDHHACAKVGRLLLNVCGAAPDGVVAFLPSFAQVTI